MKTIALAIILLAGAAEARTIIRPVVPSLYLPDYTRESVVIDDDEIYVTFPGMPFARDYTAPAYYRDGNLLIPEAINGLPGVPDWTEDAFEIDDMGEDAIPSDY